MNSGARGRAGRRQVAAGLGRDTAGRRRRDASSTHTAPSVTADPRHSATNTAARTHRRVQFQTHFDAFTQVDNNKTSSCSTGSQKPHRCCRLENKVDKIDRTSGVTSHRQPKR